MQELRSDIGKIKDIKTRDVVRYAALPGIIPRIRAFAHSGFGWLAVLMAQIYYAVRLLPAGHPYLHPDNRGRFGIRHVIVEAANRLVLKKENIDQIIVFFALVLGFLLLVFQVALILFSFLIKPAAAGMAGQFAGLFITPDPTNDIAFMLMDRVFAIPELFGSVYDPGVGGIPLFNQALHQLFYYYNLVILIVGVFVFLYYIIIMVGETMQSGTPFGRRFNHIWAPLRLVVAVGLLVPIHYGFNSAQYITLFAAKMGSSFATNGWTIFNEALNGTNPTTYDRGEQIIAHANAPEIEPLVSFSSLAMTCKLAYEHVYANEGMSIQPYVVSGAEWEQATNVGYDAALEFYDYEDIMIVYGEHDEEAHGDYAGYVKPYCGRLRVHTNDVVQAGALMMQEFYYRMPTMIWDLSGDLRNLSWRAIYAFLPQHPYCAGDNGNTAECKTLPEAEVKRALVQPWQELLVEDVIDARIEQINGMELAVPDELIARGWAGAGIWYNRIAQWNGSFFASVMNIPTVANMPMVMEEVERQKRGQDASVTGHNRYDPYIQKSGGTEIRAFNDAAQHNIARTLSEMYSYWMEPQSSSTTDQQVSGNVFFDVLNAMFGINGLFEMRQNVDTHPLAQLVGLGKSILDSALRNLMTSLAFSALGGMTQMINEHMGSALNHFSGMFVALASMGMTIGFILYYVLPFLPFMYFFFAVGGWVKGIFEAMVGVPLWALAHLRVDGNGFPTEQAIGGYFLIFEIFARPILCVFGLLAAVTIFAAMARTLNDIFDIVVSNLTGFDCTDCGNAGGGVATLDYFKRNVVDEFFYTIIYAILVYLLAISSFKLIDQIPQSIIRWMGSGVQTFNDQREDPTQGLVQYAAFGGYSMAGQAIGAANQGARTLGNVAGAPIGLAMRNSRINIGGMSGGSGGGAGGGT